MAAVIRLWRPIAALAPGTACRSITRLIPKPISPWRPTRALPPIWRFWVTACPTATPGWRNSLKPAQLAPDRSFLIGGSGWGDVAMPANIRKLGHVGTADHNALNCTPRMVLNVARDSMAANGFSPATRVFEAAGAGACLITDRWEGIELFLKPDAEVLVARDGQDVADLLAGVGPDRARAIGRAALARVLADHTYANRAEQADVLFRAHARRMEAAE